MSMKASLAAAAIGLLTIGAPAFAAPLSGGASGGGAIQGGSGAPGGGTGIPGAIVTDTTGAGIGIDDTHGRHYWRHDRAAMTAYGTLSNERSSF